MNNNKKLLVGFVLNIILIILAYSSFAPIFSLSVYGELTSKSLSGTFRFFTNDGNLYSTLVTCVLISFQISILLFKKNPNIIRNNILYLLSLGSAVSELIILFVVVYLLMPFFGSKILIGNYTMFNLHFLMPVIVTIRFIFFEYKRIKINYTNSLYGSIPVLFYGVIILFLIIIKVFNEENKKIPYPFLNIYGNPWWATLLYFLVLFGFTFGFCIFLNYLNDLFEDVLLDNKEKNSNFMITPSEEQNTYEL